MTSQNRPTNEEIYEHITKGYIPLCYQSQYCKNLALNEITIPQKLYQYCPFDEKNHSINNFKKSEIFCSSVENFSDSFEGALTIHELDRMFKDNCIDMNSIPFVNEEIKTEILHTNCQARTNKMVKNLYGISCFAPQNDSKYMWGLYADKSKGFCVEYDFTKFNFDNNNSFISPVAYSDTRIDYSHQMKECENDCKKCLQSLLSIRKALVTKNSDLGHEEEWRIICKNPLWKNWGSKFLDDAFNGVPLDVSSCITGLYLGAMIGKSDKDNVAQIIKQAENLKIPIYQKEMSPDKFELTEKLIWSP